MAKPPQPFVSRNQAPAVTLETVVWGYRLFLDREPEGPEAVRTKAAGHSTIESLRRDFMSSPEFKMKNPGLSAAARGVVLALLDDQLRLFVDLSDLVIGLNIVLHNYELSESSFVRKTVKPGMTVLDIGANIGYFSVLLASLVGAAGRVYSYEPIAANLTLLSRSIAENSFDDRITVRPFAVGDGFGTARLVHLPLERQAMNSGGSYLLPPGSATCPPGHDLVGVPLVSLDREDLRRPVSFIKVDVEGSEPMVFRGAKSILESDRPTILSEINSQQLQLVAGQTPSSLISEMEALRYHCHPLKDGVPAGRISSCSDEGMFSAVFLPA